MASKKKDVLTASVVITISVSEKEWMERYGDHIRANMLVPQVTLINALKKAAREKLAELNFETLEVQ